MKIGGLKGANSKMLPQLNTSVKEEKEKQRSFDAPHVFVIPHS
jgi:hypothetical protein